MTTYSNNTTVANTSNATFQAWVAEVVNALVTQVGLTQTADTGQINPATVALPGAANTSAGYVILTFNDTLQATSPIYMKLEFGTGSAVANPMMWLTVGTGSNGSGTINGTAMSRSAIAAGAAVVSTVTNYTSRYCYNATQGVLWFGFKLNAIAGTNIFMAGVAVVRSVNSSGVPTSNSVLVLFNNYNSATGNSSSDGQAIFIDYSLSSVVQLAGPTAWGVIPFSATSTLEGTQAQVFPCFQYSATAATPGFGIHNAYAICVLNEFPLNSTAPITILGSTSLTYLCAGLIFAGGGIALGYSPANYSMALLWQ